MSAIQIQIKSTRLDILSSAQICAALKMLFSNAGKSSSESCLGRLGRELGA